MSAKANFGHPARRLLRLSIILVIAGVLPLTSSIAVAGGDPASGKEKAKACAQCHGDTGHSVDPTFPVLAGQYSDYLILALEEYKAGTRKNAIMAGFAAQLTDEDRADIAAFYSEQDGLKTINYAK